MTEFKRTRGAFAPLDPEYLEQTAHRLANAHLAIGGNKLPRDEHASFFFGVPHEHRDAVRKRAETLVRLAIEAKR